MFFTVCFSSKPQDLEEVLLGKVTTDVLSDADMPLMLYSHHGLALTELEVETCLSEEVEK